MAAFRNRQCASMLTTLAAKRSRDRRVDDKRMLETPDERAGADEPLKSRELHNIDSADDFDGVWQHSAERFSDWPFFERQQQPNAIEAAQETTRKDEAARFGCMGACRYMGAWMHVDTCKLFSLHTF